MTVLDGDRVRALFHELSDSLAQRGESASLFVVGGAAMALAYDNSRATRDVDALFVPAPVVREIAEQIATVHDLEPDWLNDAAKGFLPGNDTNPTVVFESEHLLVHVPSPRYLLAMKLHASRDERDLDDAATLMSVLKLTTPDQALDVLTGYYPASQLLPRHRYTAQEVADRTAARRTKELRHKAANYPARGITPHPDRPGEPIQTPPSRTNPPKSSTFTERRPPHRADPPGIGR
jgi:hypothetical protein